MKRQEDYFSSEIMNQGTNHSGSFLSSPTFSVRVPRVLPNFLSSVNLKYVKLSYCYLINHVIYFAGLPILLLIFGTQVGKLSILLLLGFLCLFVLTPRSTYLVDYACYLPPNDLKITREEFIELAKKSGQFNEKAIEFQKRALNNSGLGDETYMPRVVFQPDYWKNLNVGREEAATSMFGAVDDLLAATRIHPKEIKILIVNCGILNTTPSLSAMVINRYRLSHRIQSFNLGGMGCAAGITAIDLADDLLNAYPGSYALIVSTEVISSSWYSGNELDMLLPNCFFRMGAAAVLLSNHRLHKWRSKYQLKQLVRTHKGMDDKSYKSIQLKEDSQGKQGLSVSKNMVEIGGQALNASITTLGPLINPVSEQFHFFKSLFFKKRISSKLYIADYKLAFEHVCILATSKKVLDEVQKNLGLTDEYMEASRKTLERFGNTSSSSIWYELAYLEAKNKVKKGDMVCQLALGSGLKCNSVVWRAVRSVEQPKRKPWNEN